MPSTNPFDPSNYVTVVAPGEPTWHSGTGTITYGFLSKVPSYYPPSVTGTYDVGGYEVASTASVALSTIQKTLVNQAMATFNEVANVHLTLSSSSTPDIAFGAYTFDDPDLFGFAWYPSVADQTGGDVWLNNTMSEVRSPAAGDEGWVTILHEVGHALGLKHPFEDTPQLATSLDNSQYTVMSYDPHPASSTVWPLTPMLYDIAALQHLYGANMTTRADNTTYLGLDAAAVYGLANGGAMILTIWDGGGIDTIDASNQTGASVIDLQEGHFSSIGALANNVGIAFGAVIEHAKGGAGNDRLTGNAAANRIVGGAGNDTMDGGDGIDTVAYGPATVGVRVDLSITSIQATGGGGSDTLVRFENISGSNYADHLTGSTGANTLWGNAGNDQLFGGTGNDTLSGGKGDDRLNGGTGIDQLWGGAGKDIFVFANAANAVSNVDALRDYAVVDDTIQLSAAAFSKAGPVGALAAAAFHIGPAAGDASDRIVYQAATGNLYYDADGTGAAAQVKFAVVTPGLVLSAAEFVIA